MYELPVTTLICMYVEVQGFENISRRFLNLTKIVLCDVIATADLIAPM